MKMEPKHKDFRIAYSLKFINTVLPRKKFPSVQLSGFSITKKSLQAEIEFKSFLIKIKHNSQSIKFHHIKILFLQDTN